MWDVVVHGGEIEALTGTRTCPASFGPAPRDRAELPDIDPIGDSAGPWPGLGLRPQPGTPIGA